MAALGSTGFRVQPERKKEWRGGASAVGDEGRLSYHPELAAGVNFLSGTQTLLVSVMFSHRSGPADPALTVGTRVVAAERGQWAGARLTLLR